MPSLMLPTDDGPHDLGASSPPASTAATPDEALNHEWITWAGLLFEAASELERRVAATLREHDLAYGVFVVLLLLARSEGGRLRMSELSRRLAITTGGVARL